MTLRCITANARGVRLTLAILLATALAACATTPPGGAPAPAEAQAADNEATLFGRRADDAAPELEQFGRFAGRWECRIRERTRDGDWVPRAATVLWSWFYALGGYAVQDVWEPRAGGSRPFGTSLWLFDTARGVWKSVWAASDRAEFEYWEGAEAGGEIVMQLRSERLRARIVFFEIADSSFAWRYERVINDDWLAVLRSDCTRLGRRG